MTMRSRWYCWNQSYHPICVWMNEVCDSRCSYLGIWHQSFQLCWTSSIAYIGGGFNQIIFYVQPYLRKWSKLANIFGLKLPTRIVTPIGGFFQKPSQDEARIQVVEILFPRKLWNCGTWNRFEKENHLNQCHLDQTPLERLLYVCLPPFT